MIRRPPRSTLFPYTNALPICILVGFGGAVAAAIVMGLAAFVSRLARGLVHDALAILNRSEEHTSELQSRLHLACRLLLEKKNDRALPPTRAGPSLVCCSAAPH